MRQISQTIIILFLTLLLTSLAPAGQLLSSDCQGSVAIVKTKSACCKAAAEMAESSMCSESATVDHTCPLGGWCQVDADQETYWRAPGGWPHFDYVSQNLAALVQAVSVVPAKTGLSGLSPPVRGSTPRYILICSFLI